MNETKSLIPPSFVNAPSDPVYDAELPDPLFRTYIRLRGLAWQSKYRETPPLRVEELAEICHHNVRSTWGHLSALRERGLVTWHTVRGRMVFDLQPLQNFAVDDAGDTGQDSQGRSELLQNFAVEPSPLQNFAVDQALQNFAVHNDDGGVTAATDPPDRGQQQQPLLQKFAVNPPLLQNFAVPEQVAANLIALAAYGVDTAADAAQEAAGLDHVTPDLVQAWGEHLSGRPCRNLPGLLLYKLRTTQHPPRTGERRGGNRQGPVAVGPCQDALPIPEGAEQPVREIVTVDAAAGLLKRQQARTGREAVAVLLEDFGIVAPVSEQIIARSPDSGDVRGWMLYTLGQPGLDGKAEGYVVNRLLAGETPPGSFRRWAQLEPEEWQALWHTCRYGTPGHYGGACAVDVDLAAWREDFAGMFPRGPFGDGRRLESEMSPSISMPDEESPLADEWEAVLDDLRLQMTQATFDTWLHGSRLIRRTEDVFVVGVKSIHAGEWLKHRLLPVITRTLARRVGHSVGIEFVAPEEGES